MLQCVSEAAPCDLRSLPYDHSALRRKKPLQEKKNHKWHTPANTDLIHDTTFSILTRALKRTGHQTVEIPVVGHLQCPCCICAHSCVCMRVCN